MFTLLNKTSVARKTGGFTLVELLVVIVVIGLLAAIAVPIFLSQADKANTASAESDAANIAKLIQADYAETGTVSAMNGSTYTSANGFGSVTAAGTVSISGDATTWCVESDVDGQVASFSAENGAGTGCPVTSFFFDSAQYSSASILGGWINGWPGGGTVWSSSLPVLVIDTASNTYEYISAGGFDAFDCCTNSMFGWTYSKAADQLTATASKDAQTLVIRHFASDPALGDTPLEILPDL